MKPNSGMSNAYIPLIILCLMVMAVILRLGLIFMMLALLPSVVLFFSDGEKRKPVFKIVASCNVAAALPSLGPIVRAGIKLKNFNVSEMMADPRVWLFIYSGAAAGWCLLYLCRLIGRFSATLTYEQHIATLERAQKQLVEEWGEDVKNTADSEDTGIEEE